MSERNLRWSPNVEGKGNGHEGQEEEPVTKSGQECFVSKHLRKTPP